MEPETIAEQIPVDQEQPLVQHSEFVLFFSSKTFKVQVGL